MYDAADGRNLVGAMSAVGTKWTIQTVAAFVRFRE